MEQDRQKKTSEKFTEVTKGEAKAKAAAAVNMSRPTLAKAQKVVEAVAADSDLAPILEEIDRTGKALRRLAIWLTLGKRPLAGMRQSKSELKT